MQFPPSGKNSKHERRTPVHRTKNVSINSFLIGSKKGLPGGPYKRPGNSRQSSA
jgi:hypothetical protein